MKTKMFHIGIKKVITLCLLFVPLILLTGCSNLLTPESIDKIIKYGKNASGIGTGVGLLGSITESTTQCWPCSTFIVTWNAIGEAYSNLYTPTSQMARLLLGVGLLFWLSLTIGKMVCQLKEPNLKDYIPKIAGVLFKAACVGIILSSPKYTVTVINLFMEPILTGTIYISKLVLPNDLDTESTILDILSAFSFPSTLIGSVVTDTIHNNPVFTKEIGETMRDVIYNLFDVLKGGFVLGGKMMFQIDPMGVASGVLILCTFFYFMFYFPLLLLEGFLSLGVALILFPFFMAGWVFPSTKNYMNEVIKIIFQSVAQILVTCIYISVIIAIIQANHDMFSITRMVSDPLLITGIGNMNNNGLAFLGMIFCLFKLTNDIPSITSYFVGEMNKSMIARHFSKMQNLMASGAKMVVGSAMVGTGVLGSVGKAMVAQGARDTLGEATKMESSEAQQTTGDIREQTRPNGQNT